MSSTRTSTSATKDRILVKLLAQMAEIQRENVCGRIAEARREAGLTQQEMADALDVTLRGYQTYEASRVPWRRLDQIAEITGKSKQWLIHGTKPDEPQQEPAPVSAEIVEAMGALTNEIRRLNARIDQMERRAAGDAVE